jgi:hypothetical protein
MRRHSPNTQTNAKTNLTQMAELAYILTFGSSRLKMKNDEAVLVGLEITAGRSSLSFRTSLRNPYLRRIPRTIAEKRR